VRVAPFVEFFAPQMHIGRYCLANFSSVFFQNRNAFCQLTAQVFHLLIEFYVSIYYLTHRLSQVAETPSFPSEAAKISFQRVYRIIDLPEGTSDIIGKITDQRKSPIFRHYFSTPGL
jgi:hypothetical protein